MPWGAIASAAIPAISSMFGGDDEGGGSGTQHTHTVNQRPAWWDEDTKDTLETAKRAFGDEWQDYLNPAHAPTADTIKRMEQARLAPRSGHTREANTLFNRADPRNAEHQVHDENVRRNVDRLANSTTQQRVRNPEERLNRDPRELARQYEDNYRENVVNPLREEEEALRQKEEAGIRSLPIHNRPGSRNVGKGQLERDLKTSRFQASKRWGSQLHKALDTGQQRAHERALNYRASDIAQLANVGNLQQRDMIQQMEALKMLKDINTGDVDKYYKHGAVKLGLGSKEEARNQTIRDLLYARHHEKLEHPKRNIERRSAISAQAQSPTSVQHQIATNTPGTHGTGNDLASNLLYSIGRGFGRENHAEGGLAGEAVFNSMIDNTDPLDTMNKMMRHQLMLGLMKRRRKYNRGGSVAAATSPIQTGAEMAKRVAAGGERSAKYNDIMDRQLEESRRLREPEQPASMGSQLMESIDMGLAATPGYNSLGKIGMLATARKHASRAASEARRKTSFDLEKEVAKEMEAARKGDHSMAMDERRVKNDERRAGIDEARLGLDRRKADYEMGNIAGRGEDIGDLPTKKMSPQREESIKKAHHQGEQILHTMKAAINAFNHVKDIEGGSGTEWAAEHPGITLGLGSHIAGAVTGKKGSEINTASKSVNEFINQAGKSGGEGGQRAFAYVTQSKMGKGGLGMGREGNADYFGGSVANSIEDYKETIKDAKRSGDSPNDIAAMEQKLAEMKELQPFLEEVANIKAGKGNPTTAAPSGDDYAMKVAETKKRLEAAQAKNRSMKGKETLQGMAP